MQPNGSSYLTPDAQGLTRRYHERDLIIPPAHQRPLIPKGYNRGPVALQPVAEQMPAGKAAKKRGRK